MSSVPGRSRAHCISIHTPFHVLPRKLDFVLKCKILLRKVEKLPEGGASRVSTHNHICISAHTHTYGWELWDTLTAEHTYSHTYNDMHVRWWWTTFDLFRFQAGESTGTKFSKLTHFNFIKHCHHTVAASYDQPVRGRKKGDAHIHIDTHSPLLGWKAAFGKFIYCYTNFAVLCCGVFCGTLCMWSWSWTLNFGSKSTGNGVKR